MLPRAASIFTISTISSDGNRSILEMIIIADMAEPDAKRPRTNDDDLERAALRMIGSIVDEIKKNHKESGEELVLRQLLEIHAKMWIEQLATKTPLKLRDTLDAVGLTDAVVLEERPADMVEANMLLCGNMELDIILMKSSPALMECTKFHARPFEGMWIVDGML